MNTLNIRDFLNEKKNWRVIILFLLFFIIGNITYATLIVNELPNPDAIWNSTIYKDSWSWECSLGRYMLGIFQNLFDDVVNPATFTILAIGMLALVCVVLTSIFETNDFHSFLMGLLVLFTPAITGTLTYYYCSLYYAIAYLWMALAAYFACKRNSIASIILSSILICFSLATYQAYISCFIVIAILFLISMIFQQTHNLREIISRSIRMVISLFTGILLYLFSNKIVQFLWDIDAESGRGFSKMGVLDLEQIPQLLKNCYLYTWQYFMTTDMINNFDGKLCNRRVYLLFLFVCLILVAYRLLRLKSVIYRLAALLLIAILPIGIMFITLAAPEVSIYDTTGMIMLPATNYIFFLPIILLPSNSDNKKSIILTWSVCALSVLIIIKLFNFSSAMQSYQRVCLNKMEHVAHSIANEIQRQECNTNNYEVCIIGDMTKGNYPELYDELAQKVQWTTASHGTVWKDYKGSQACWKHYIKTYCGMSYQSCDSETYNEIIETEQFMNAKNFPATGSIYLYDESVVVIKLSMP